MGVNAPTRTVVFHSLRKHDGRQFRNLLPSECCFKHLHDDERLYVCMTPCCRDVGLVPIFSPRRVFAVRRVTKLSLKPVCTQ